MTRFLDWLYGKRNAAYVWLDYLYDKAVNVVNNVEIWIQQKYLDALRFAREIVMSMENRIRSYILYLVGLATQARQILGQNLRGFIASTVQRVYDYIRNEVKGITKRALDNYALLREFSRVLFDNFSRSFIDRLKNLEKYLRNLVDTFNKHVTDRLTEFVKDIVKIKRFLQMDDRTKARIFLAFIDNPGEFILTYLKRMFYTFLEYFFAYALGHTEEDLPPWPKFKDLI